MSKAVAITSEYRNLPLVQLQESPTNPRRRFNERAMEELAANLAAQGVVQPLVVRAIEDNKYEVVAGARRFRAAHLASLKEVPVVVRVLSSVSGDAPRRSED
jgi:ParB family chromosome partitioning protein